MHTRLKRLRSNADLEFFKPCQNLKDKVIHFTKKYTFFKKLITEEKRRKNKCTMFQK